MHEISTIGLDLAKSVFVASGASSIQVHAVGQDGRIVLRRQVRRARMLEFFGTLGPCLIGMEACAFVGETIPRIVSWPSSPHYWARELAKSGHEVRLMPPSYVKPYVKRGKTDAIDAEAICKAVTRPNMRFVPVKTEDQQAALMRHRTRDFLVRQQTQLSVAPQVRFQRNAIRAHLGAFGIVTAKGVHHVERLLTLADAAILPEAARQSIRQVSLRCRTSKRPAIFPRRAGSTPSA